MFDRTRLIRQRPTAEEGFGFYRSSLYGTFAVRSSVGTCLHGRNTYCEIAFWRHRAKKESY